MAKANKTRAVSGVAAREDRFVEEYLKDLDGAAAAVRAGYKDGPAAKVTASRVLGRPRVKALVQSAMEARARRTGITSDRVLKETELISFSSIDHYVVDAQGYLRAAPGAPEGVMRAVSSLKRKVIIDKAGNVSYEVEFRLWNKPEMLKISGKHVGEKGFADKLELTGKDGKDLPAPVIFELPNNGRAAG